MKQRKPIEGWADEETALVANLRAQIELLAQESDAEFARLTGIIFDKEKEVRDLRIDNARLRDEKAMAEIDARKDIEIKKQLYDDANHLRGALSEIASLYSGAHGFRATEIAKNAIRDDGQTSQARE